MCLLGSPYHLLRQLISSWAAFWAGQIWKSRLHRLSDSFRHCHKVHAICRLRTVQHHAHRLRLGGLSRFRCLFFDCCLCLRRDCRCCLLSLWRECSFWLRSRWRDCWRWQRQACGGCNRACVWRHIWCLLRSLARPYVLSLSLSWCWCIALRCNLLRSAWVVLALCRLLNFLRLLACQCTLGFLDSRRRLCGCLWLATFRWLWHGHSTGRLRIQRLGGEQLNWLDPSRQRWVLWCGWSFANLVLRSLHFASLVTLSSHFSCSLISAWHCRGRTRNLIWLRHFCSCMCMQRVGHEIGRSFGKKSRSGDVNLTWQIMIVWLYDTSTAMVMKVSYNIILYKNSLGIGKLAPSILRPTTFPLGELMWAHSNQPTQDLTWSGNIQSHHPETRFPCLFFDPSYRKQTGTIIEGIDLWRWFVNQVGTHIDYIFYTQPHQPKPCHGTCLLRTAGLLLLRCWCRRSCWWMRLHRRDPQLPGVGSSQELLCCVHGCCYYNSTQKQWFFSKNHFSGPPG